MTFVKNGEVLILVGGWNGRKRSNSVHAFNLTDQKWICVKEWAGGRGRVPPPVGLSGHTATAINDRLICILGREGGIKTQRRFGDLFLLNLDLGNFSSVLSSFSCLSRDKINIDSDCRLF